MNKQIGILIILIIVFFTGCTIEKESIKIGFIGTLTGPYADVGTRGRNAAQLAFEEVNELGGVNGHKLELLIRDDKSDSDIAYSIAEEMISDGVVAILGPTLSNTALKLVPYMNDQKTILISSTVSTNSLDNLDDYHIKFISVQNRYEILTNLLLNIKEDKNVSFVYDVENQGFAENYIKAFAPHYTQSGGTIIDPIVYDHNKAISYGNIVEEIINRNVQSLVFLGDSRTTALICQQLQKKNYKGLLFSNAMTSQLIEYGGRSVEGLRLISTYNNSDTSPDFLEFKENYFNRFAIEANFSAKRNYEAANVLIEALKKNNTKEDLKETLLSRNIYEGLQGDLTINRFGDVERIMFEFIIKDQKIQLYDQKY